MCTVFTMFFLGKYLSVKYYYEYLFCGRVTVTSCHTHTPHADRDAYETWLQCQLLKNLSGTPSKFFCSSSSFCHIEMITRASENIQYFKSGCSKKKRKAVQIWVYSKNIICWGVNCLRASLKYISIQVETQNGPIMIFILIGFGSGATKPSKHCKYKNLPRNDKMSRSDAACSAQWIENMYFVISR